jgi:phenylpropionate dioxygenase-like ring-hydroxylating dioxygenase large terminal subunit
MPDAIVDDLIDENCETGVFRVNRRALVAADVFEQERRRIFERSWIYVGHVSEIPDKGSFISRKVIGRPLILVRDDEGDIRVMFNACTHRGNKLCRETRGHTKRFQCFYHGWTFDTQGRLIAVPDEEGYSAGFDKSAYGLGQAPRVESYRGLIFMSLDPAIVDLKTYLGEMKDYLDLLFDQSDEMEISAGQQRYQVKTNWKLYVENSLDGYHALITHHRYFVTFLKDMGQEPTSWNAMSEAHPENVVRDLGNGHALLEFPLGNIPLSAGAKSGYLFDERQRLVKKFGEQRTRRMLDFNRNLFVFPNLMIIAHWRALRTFDPTAPDHVEVESFAIGNKDEPPDIRRLRLSNFLSFQGPGGFATPDDIEALEGCQRGFAAREMEWSDISRGMQRKPISTDEFQMRVFWRRWYQLLNAAYVPQRERAPRHAEA